MSFKDAIFFILKRLRKTLQIEIDEWFEFNGGENSMTKQAFSQLRQKIKSYKLYQNKFDESYASD